MGKTLSNLIGIFLTEQIHLRDVFDAFLSVILQVFMFLVTRMSYVINSLAKRNKQICVLSSYHKQMHLLITHIKC